MHVYVLVCGCGLVSHWLRLGADGLVELISNFEKINIDLDLYLMFMFFFFSLSFV